MGSSAAGVSIAIEEVPQEEWEEKVYKPEVIAKEELLDRHRSQSKRTLLL